MAKAKVSVVISAFNEEKKIKACLDSIKWADEIILIDSSSTDKTVEIAKEYTDKIYTRENNLMLNINKNFGFTKATQEWILSLDADERVSKELEKEIEQVIVDQSSKEINGYYIPRKNIIFGKWIQHTGWYPDMQLRLFRRGKGKFAEQHVHEMVTLDGKVAHLKEHIIHFNYESVSQFLHKMIVIYAPNEAQERMKNGYSFDYLDAIRFPFREFLNRFFGGEGYKDGVHGLILSLFMSFYHFVVFAYIWEEKKFVDAQHDDVLEIVQKEIGRSQKELKELFYNKKILHSKNPLQSMMLRITKKLS